jgi:hypothetical protein
MILSNAHLFRSIARGLVIVTLSMWAYGSMRVGFFLVDLTACSGSEKY